MLLLLLQFHIAVMISFNLFCLIVHFSLEIIAMVILHGLDVFSVFSFHFSSRSLYFVHSFFSILLPLFYLPH